MRITTESAIDISESLAAFLLGSYIYQKSGVDPEFERRLSRVKTGKYSIADIYRPDKQMAIEVKSKAHGSGALKGVLQASMYKEEVRDAVFCMQRPRRVNLADTIENMATSYGVGVVWIDSIPNILNSKSIMSFTGGCSKPFELWKGSTYLDTKINIINKSKSPEDTKEFLNTVDSIIYEKKDDIFDASISPDANIDGLFSFHM